MFFSFISSGIFVQYAYVCVCVCQDFLLLSLTISRKFIHVLLHFLDLILHSPLYDVFYLFYFSFGVDFVYYVSWGSYGESY